MKKFTAAIVFLSCLFVSGCGNLSPRDNFNPKLQQDINNQQGRIEKIENNQNAIRTDIEKLALINRENNNSGLQILQGDGALIMVFGLTTIGFILFYFYKVAANEKKTAEILAQQIVKSEDFSLEDNVLKASEHTEVEERVKLLMTKEKKKWNLSRDKN